MLQNDARAGDYNEKGCAGWEKDFFRAPHIILISSSERMTTPGGCLWLHASGVSFCESTYYKE